MRERQLGIPVVGLCDASEGVLIGLSSLLDAGHEEEEAEEEPELRALSVDGVHAVEGEGSAEALVAHVETIGEAKLLNGHSTTIDMRLFVNKVLIDDVWEHE